MKTLVKMQFGSHVYGTNVPTSDNGRLYGYVYITTNTANGKRYIGMKKIRSLRGQIDDYYLGSGKALKTAIRMYGKGAFRREIVYLSFCEDDLARAEQVVIATYNAVEDTTFYNMAHGGKGVSLRGDRHPRFGKPLPEGHRKAIAMASRFRGHRHTEKAKQRISEKNSGSGNFFYGKSHTEETRKILSEKAKIRLQNRHPMQGRKQSTESIALNTMNQPSVIPLLFEGDVYSSINNMQKRLGFSHSKVRRMIRDGLVLVLKSNCNGRQVTA